MTYDLTPIIAEIRYWHRKRCYTMESRKISDLRLGAHLRTQLGWSRSLPKAEAVKIAKQAQALITLGEKVVKGKTTAVDDPVFATFSDIIMASIQGRLLWDELESNATKEMERLAATLPVWAAWGEGVKGFGPRSLAVIVGEAGDLSGYPKKGHLWKRMGLAVMDGVRQGGLSKNASKDDWIAHGYNRKRRSVMFVIGDVMVKVGDHYRKVYLARKEYEKARAKAAGLTVCPAAKIPAKRKDEFMSDGHVHRRAQRYMEKKLLQHLWQAWRRASIQMTERSNSTLPADEIEREAIPDVPEKARGSLPTAQPLPRASGERGPNSRSREANRNLPPLQIEREAIAGLPSPMAIRAVPTAQAKQKRKVVAG